MPLPLPCFDAPELPADHRPSSRAPLPGSELLLTAPRRLSRRSAALAAVALASTGCFGSFSASRKLWTWNKGVGDKWVNWLVFVGLSIVPVYALFGIADVLVLNSLEFWTGENPVLASGDGRSVHRVALADPTLLRLEVRRARSLTEAERSRAGANLAEPELESAVVLRRSHGAELEVLDLTGRTLSRVVAGADGGFELFSGEGRRLASLTAAAAERVGRGARQGSPILALLERALGSEFQVARGRAPWGSTNGLL